jgi:hypothetical protein
MRSPHPTCNDVGHGKRFQDLAHGGKSALRPNDTHRVIFANVFAGDQGQPFCGRHRPNVTIFGINRFYHVSARGPDEDQQIINVGRGVEENPLMAFNVEEVWFCCSYLDLMQQWIYIKC